MSQENVKKFLAEIEKNQELKTKYMDAMKESQNLFTSKLVDAGNKAGFKFTNEDLHAAHAEMLDSINGNTELGDEDLAKAAGGRVNPGMVLASIFTLGIACAAVSAINEATTKPAGGCKRSFEVK